jgi:hypothetical protein
MGMKGTQTLVSTAVAPAEGSTPANPETAMARMEAVDHGCAGVLDQAGFSELLGKLVER